MRLLNRFKRLIQGDRGGDKPAVGQPHQSTESLQKLLQMVDQTQEEEYSCDEVYQQLDQYTESVVSGEDAAQLMPLVKHHLDMCPDCREEFEALLNILEGVPSS